MTSSAEFDYIIIGAGSAGCALANRLTEDPDTRVLLLEAGGWDRDPLISIPLGIGQLWKKRLHDWGYDVEPEPELGGRAVECMRGKVIGGSSSINAMAYVRGHRTDFDRLAASGLPGWSYAHALPYFRRQEQWEGGASVYRGGDGPLATRNSRYADPLVEAWFEAGAAMGQPYTEDYNGAQQEGFGRLQSCIRNGRRDSSASAYLRPALRRRGLRVEVNALVTRLLIDGTSANGVEYVQDGQRHSVRASREILLCGGAINSPQILMRSGIGAPDELRRLGIEVKAALPGVGENLQDHLSVRVPYLRPDFGLLHRNMRLDRVMLGMARAYLCGTGFATDIPAGLMAFLRTDSSLPAADVQLMAQAAPLEAAPYLPPFMPAYADGFAIVAVLLRPESMGSVKLRSADPGTKPVIRQNFLATDKDKKTIRAGIRMIRDLVRQRPMARYVASGRSSEPGESDAEIDAHIRAIAATAHHPLGTCRMGLASDPLAVVDEDLRVLGVSRLRVVDASALPNLIGGNINAPTVMLAERGADLIRGRTPLAPMEPLIEPIKPDAR